MPVINLEAEICKKMDFVIDDANTVESVNELVYFLKKMLVKA